MRIRTIRWTALIAASAFGSLAGVGCAASRDRLVYDNYTQIRSNVHMQADVEAILGEPDQKMADTWIYQRPDKHLVVMVEFDEQGKVSRTQWVDAMGETWHDTSDKGEAKKE